MPIYLRWIEVLFLGCECGCKCQRGHATVVWDVSKLDFHNFSYSSSPHDWVNFLTEFQQRVDLVRPLEVLVVWRQLINQFLALRDQQVDPLQGRDQVLFGGHPPIAGKDDERVRPGGHVVHVHSRVAAVADGRKNFLFLWKHNLTVLI